MDTYVIEKAYHWTNDAELSITSENLTYVELGTNRHGGQTNTNNPQILKKCAEICDLIREIEELNNSEMVIGGFIEGEIIDGITRDKKYKVIHRGKDEIGVINDFGENTTYSSNCFQ